MIVFYVATKVLDTEKFPQHTNADLNSGITFIVLFSQENKHTHTHTHTHTHRGKHQTFFYSFFRYVDLTQDNTGEAKF